MPRSEKQRRAACARAAGKPVMTSMPKATAKEWCRSKIHKGKK